MTDKLAAAEESQWRNLEEGLCQPAACQAVRDRAAVDRFATGYRLESQGRGTERTPRSKRQFQRDVHASRPHRR